jgi:hypothetical protein
MCTLHRAGGRSAAACPGLVYLVSTTFWTDASASVTSRTKYVPAGSSAPFEPQPSHITLVVPAWHSPGFLGTLPGFLGTLPVFHPPGANG